MRLHLEAGVVGGQGYGLKWEACQHIADILNHKIEVTKGASRENRDNPEAGPQGAEFRELRRK